MQFASTLKVLPLLVRMHVRSQMEYRGAFWLDRIAQIIAYSSAYGAIWLLVDRFQNLGGWVWPELALLVSFQLLGYSLGAALSFVQLRDLEETVRLGLSIRYWSSRSAPGPIWSSPGSISAMSGISFWRLR